MTARHRNNSDASSKPNSLRSEVECLPPTGMVSQERLSEEPKSTSTEDVRVEPWTDDVDVNSLASSQDEDCASETGLELSQPDEPVGSFGNIVVKNSSDVQFGNNTYYQGPVTIKQFVYKGGQDGQLSIENGGTENPVFVPECVIESSSDYVKSEKNIDNNEKNTNILLDNTRTNKGAQWLNYAYRNRSLLIICISFILIVTVVLLTTLLVKKYQYDKYSGGYPVDSDELQYNTPVPPPLDPNVNVTLSGKLKIISRPEWLAQPPVEPPKPLKHPVPYVIILHTATENCSDQATCTFHVRTIQTFHIESKGWWDIGYNFLVGGDGFAYEGRGWKGEGAHVYGYNSRSIGIAFIGTFNTITPPKQQVLACRQLIELGVQKGYIAENYKLLAHKQLATTQSPGEALYKEMKTWPHWSPNP